MGRETKAQAKERAEFTAKLREVLKPGDTVYTVLRHVSRSGMYRAIDVYIVEDGEPMRLTYWVAKACGLKYDTKREAIGVGGCGMDMGFHVVYELSSVLFPGGFGCIGDGHTAGELARNPQRMCPSNDHSNGDRDYSPHVDDTPRDSSEVGTDIPRKRAHWHKSGGYALRHRWM